MPKFSLLQPEYTLIDLLLEQLSRIFIIHQLPHPRCQQPLIIKLLILALARPLPTLLTVLVAADTRQLLGILSLACIRLIVEKPVVHELLLNILHPFMYLGSSPLLPNLNPIRSKINLLFSSSFPIKVPIRRKVLLANLIRPATEPSSGLRLLLQDPERPLRPVIRRK